MGKKKKNKKNKKKLAKDLIQEDLIMEEIENAEIDTAAANLEGFSDKGIDTEVINPIIEQETKKVEEISDEEGQKTVNLKNKLKPNSTVDREEEVIVTTSVAEPTLSDFNITKKDGEKEKQETDEEEEDVYPSSDNIKFKDDETVIVEQLENVVTWEIRGLYNKNGKLKKKMTLTKKPPIFSISSSSGDMAEFIVSKDMSFQLYKNFELIYKAYFGLDGREKDERPFGERVNDNWKKFVHWVKLHPVKFIFTAIVLTIFVVFVIIGLIRS